MASLGMHWFIIPASLIPADLVDGILKSPIKLLDESIAEIKSQKQNFADKHKAIIEEVEMIDNIETTDEDVFQVTEGGEIVP